MSKIKSLPGQRLCSSLPPDRVPWETSDAIPRNGHRKVAPQPPRPQGAGAGVAHPHGRVQYLSFRRVEPWADLHAPGVSRVPHPQGPDAARICFMSTISMIRIVPCCCPCLRGRARSCVRSFRRRWRISAKELPRPSGQREVRQETFRIAGSFSGRAFRAHQADGQDRRERGLQSRYG